MILFWKIWAILAILLFLILMTLSVPIILFNMIFYAGERALKRNIYYLHHVFTPIFLTLVGIRLKIEGQEHLDSATSYVIVSNHRSSLDFIVNAHSFPGIFRFLAKQELLKIPVFGWVVKKMCLIVDRSSAISRARSVVALKQQLAEGTSVFIYPEGSRVKTNDPIGTFYDGAFRIAIQTGAPLAIQTIANIAHITANGTGLRPGIVRIFWEKPIDTSTMGPEHISQLKEKTEEIIKKRVIAYMQ